MQIHSTDDETLISAMRTLARDIQSADGVANAAIAEAADRIAEYMDAMETIRDAVLNERFQMAEAGFSNDQVNAVLGIIDDHNPRVWKDSAENA